MTTVHRLLDDAFSGVDLTPEVQDLKEEIRANLEARTLELQASGSSPVDAARRAFDELGDVRALVADASAGPGTPVARAVPSPMTGYGEAALRNKVRPRPAFAVGVVLASVVGAVALVFAVLGAFGGIDTSHAAVLGAVGVVALVAGVVTGVSLAQETTANHPLPAGRAVTYGCGVGLVVAGAGTAGAAALLSLAAGWFVAAGLVLVAGVCLLSALGATQTNRKKAWARDAERAATPKNRFDEDPAAAARFGLYTAGIWTAAAGVYLGLGFAGGWAWCWITFVVASGLWLFMLARMLFGTGPAARGQEG